MGSKASELTVFDGLSVVTLRGFAPERSEQVDPPGTANYLVEAFGPNRDLDAEGGILWTDYEVGGEGWEFAVLIDSEEVESLKETAAEAGYEFVSAEPVAEPTHFGDGHGGLVEILKHRTGWVVLES